VRRPRTACRTAALAALLSLASLALPRGARAEDPPAAAADAQALYDRAMAVLAEGRVEAACSMLDEVLRLQPDAIGAKVAAAECAARAGRLVTALTRYTALEGEATRAGQWARLAHVRARMEALRARAAYLSLVVPDEVKAVRGLQVRVGGVLIDSARLGERIPVDRGSYPIEVTAPGRVPLTGTVDIDSDGVTYTMTVLMPNPIPPSVPSPPPQAAPAASAEVRRRSPIPGGVVLSAGITALIVGAATGGAALSTAAALKRTCLDSVCPPSQMGTGQQANMLATMSTAEIVAGAVVTAAGITLLVLRPFGREPTAAAWTAGPRSLALVGRF
jgi:hypothetical protein